MDKVMDRKSHIVVKKTKAKSKYLEGIVTSKRNNLISVQIPKIDVSRKGIHNYVDELLSETGFTSKMIGMSTQNLIQRSRMEGSGKLRKNKSVE